MVDNGQKPITMKVDKKTIEKSAIKANKNQAKKPKIKNIGDEGQQSKEAQKKYDNKVNR